jgi:hypothetical protein
MNLLGLFRGGPAVAQPVAIEQALARSASAISRIGSERVSSDTTSELQRALGDAAIGFEQLGDTEGATWARQGRDQAAGLERLERMVRFNGSHQDPRDIRSVFKDSAPETFDELGLSKRPNSYDKLSVKVDMPTFRSQLASEAGALQQRLADHYLQLASADVGVARDSANYVANLQTAKQLFEAIDASHFGEQVAAARTAIDTLEADRANLPEAVRSISAPDAIDLDPERVAQLVRDTEPDQLRAQADGMGSARLRDLADEVDTARTALLHELDAVAGDVTVGSQSLTLLPTRGLAGDLASVAERFHAHADAVDAAGSTLDEALVAARSRIGQAALLDATRRADVLRLGPTSDAARTIAEHVASLDDVAGRTVDADQLADVTRHAGDVAVATTTLEDALNAYRVAELGAVGTLTQAGRLVRGAGHEHADDVLRQLDADLHQLGISSGLHELPEPTARALQLTDPDTLAKTTEAAYQQLSRHGVVVPPELEQAYRAMLVGDQRTTGELAGEVMRTAGAARDAREQFDTSAGLAAEWLAARGERPGTDPATVATAETTLLKAANELRDSQDQFMASADDLTTRSRKA